MSHNLLCDWCGKPIKKYRINKHNFCCRQCLADFSSKSKNPNGYSLLKDFTNISDHMTKLNEELNSIRMTKETRRKLREYHLGRGECRGYSKIYGKLAHRVIAEEILGRSLKPQEVVHHREGNRYNNVPENLVVFPSVGEHTKFHMEYRWFIRQLIRLEEETNAEV